MVCLGFSPNTHSTKIKFSGAGAGAGPTANTHSAEVKVSGAGQAYVDVGCATINQAVRALDNRVAWELTITSY